MEQMEQRMDFSPEYAAYAAQTKEISRMKKSGASQVVIAGYRLASPDYSSAEKNFMRRVRLDRAATTLRRYEDDARWSRWLEADQISCEAVAGDWDVSPGELRCHVQHLFSDVGAHELFLVREWSELEGWTPFHVVFERAREGRSAGRPPEK